MTRALVLVFVAILCLVALALGLPTGARVIAKGWLVAFLVFSSVPIGSIALLLIHRLTGGRWGVELAAPLSACAALMPLVVVAYVPIALMLDLTYPWVSNPEILPEGVGGYLNTPFFLLRSALALGFWWVCSIALLRGGPGRLAAAIALVVHGLTISLMAYDWILSLDPPFGSTAFGATIACLQILAALSVAAIVTWRRGGDAADGLGGFMIATLLGVFYLQLISFIVDWYGNLPDKAEHYLSRASLGWLIVLWLAIVAGAVAPLGLLLRQRVREQANLLAIAGALSLFGVALDMAWFVAPQAGPWWMAAFCGALFALVCMAVALTTVRPLIHRRRAHDVG